MHINRPSAVVRLLGAVLLPGLLLLGAAAQAQTGSVGIGTTSPNAKAALDVSSTNKGLLLPRLTKPQRLALSTGPTVTPPGLTIFQTGPDSVGIWAYSGVRWLWLNGSDGADNLGNHTATQNLSLGTNLLTGTGGTHGIRIGTDGQAMVSTTNPGSGLANWIATNVGAAAGDRVVSGLLGGRATLGAHDYSLSAWAPLYLNPAGNVGIGSAPASQKLTVEGQVFSTTGGFRFPDNTVQTTAAGADNLGNHTATQDLNLNTSALLGNSTGATVQGLTIAPDGRVNVTADAGGGWIASNIGALTGDRVVSGLLGGRATLGAHDDALNAWRALYLNPSGNVGIGSVTASQKLTVEGQVYSTTGGFRFPDNTVQTTANNAAPQQLSISGTTISLTNGGAVTLPPSDNLGNHTATQNLNLGPNLLTGGGTTGLAVSSAGQVGIGTPVPDASAALEVASTTRGLLPPRLSQTQRDAIAAPAAGLHIFNTSTNRPNFWDGVRWQESVSADATAPGSTQVALGTTRLTGTATGNAVLGLTMADDGQVRISSTNPGTGGANWIALNAGAAVSGDRVVMGLLNGKATIGGHDNALGAWTDLILNPEPSAGNVGIGTTAPSQKLHVVGNIVATGNIGGVSDRRYKERFAPISNALQNVLQLNGLTYYWRRAEFPEQHFGPERQLGFIAQDVEKLYPEMVATDAAGYKSVDYGRLTPVLVEAIKELKTQIDQNRAEAAGAKAEATAAKAEATAASTATADLLRRVQTLEVPGGRAGR